MARIYKEVVCDYFDEENKWWTIDAWTDPDKEDNGRVIGYVDGESGNIYYKVEGAESDPLVCEVALAKQAEVRKAQEVNRYLMDETMILMADDIYKEVYSFDYMDYNSAAAIVRDLAYKFERELDWKGNDAEERDYIVELEKFEEREMAKLRKKYC